MKNTHNFTTFAVLVLLVFNASLFITCEAAFSLRGLTGFLEKIKKGIEVGDNAFDYYKKNRPSNADIKQIQLYCRIFPAIAKDPNKPMADRRAAAFFYRKYCTN